MGIRLPRLIIWAVWGMEYAMDPWTRELIEPLIPSVLANLEHRHPYIRRNAILVMMSIYKLPQGEQLLVDAPEMIEKALGIEQDLSAKRNAFLMFFNCSQERAIGYLFRNLEAVPNWGDLLQMIVLELIRKVCRSNPAEKGKYIKGCWAAAA